MRERYDAGGKGRAEDDDEGDVLGVKGGEEEGRRRARKRTTTKGRANAGKGKGENVQAEQRRATVSEGDG